MFLERILVRALEREYKKIFQRKWVNSSTPPHFFNHRIGFFSFAFSNLGFSPRAYNRAFYTAEVIHDGDRLLDIGCGDGFFTKRFYSHQCCHIDAIDIERDAISAATRWNRALARFRAVVEPA